MDGRDLEKLFLIEILVENVNFAYSKDLETLKETCIEFQFLNLPRIIVCEEDFAPNTVYEVSDLPFNSGKSCLFSLPPNVKFGSLNIYFNVTRYDETSKRLIGTGEVPLEVDLLSVIEEQNGRNGVPVSRSVRDAYYFYRNDNSPAGKVGIFVRFSCFGRLIVTQFQVQNLEKEEFLFKNDKLVIDVGEALEIGGYAFKGATPLPPAVPPPRPPPTGRPPPMHTPIPPPPSFPPPQMPPVLQTQIPPTASDWRNIAPPLESQRYGQGPESYPPGYPVSMPASTSALEDIHKRLHTQIERRKRPPAAYVKPSPSGQPTPITGNIPQPAFGSSQQYDPRRLPLSQPLAVTPSTAQYPGFTPPGQQIYTTPSATFASDYLYPGQQLFTLSPSTTQLPPYGQQIPVTPGESQHLAPLGGAYYQPATTSQMNQGAPVQPQWPKPDQQNIPGVFEVPGYTIPLPVPLHVPLPVPIPGSQAPSNHQPEREGVAQPGAEKQTSEIPDIAARSGQPQTGSNHTQQAPKEYKEQAPSQKPSGVSFDDAPGGKVPKGLKLGKKVSHASIPSIHGDTKSSTPQKKTPDRGGEYASEGHDLEKEMDEMVSRGDDLLGFKRPKKQESSYTKKPKTRKKARGKKAKGGKGKGKRKKGKKRGKKKASKTTLVSEPRPETSDIRDELTALIDRLNNQKQDHDELAKLLQSHINELNKPASPRVSPSQVITAAQIQEYLKQQFRKIPTLIHQQTIQLQKLMAQRMELEKSLANLHGRLIQLQQQRYAQGSGCVREPRDSIAEQCLQQHYLLKQQYIEHQQLQFQLMAEQASNERILGNLQEPLTLQCMQPFQESLTQSTRQLELQDNLMRNHLTQQHKILCNQIMLQQCLDSQTLSTPTACGQIPVRYPGQSYQPRAQRLPLCMQRIPPAFQNLPPGARQVPYVQPNMYQVPSGLQMTPSSFPIPCGAPGNSGYYEKPSCFSMGSACPTTQLVRYPFPGDTMCWSGTGPGNNVIWVGNIGPDGKALWEGQNIYKV